MQYVSHATGTSVRVSTFQLAFVFAAYSCVGRILIITSAKEDMISPLFVCLSVSNFVQKLPNRFACSFQGRLAMGQ